MKPKQEAQQAKYVDFFYNERWLKDHSKRIDKSDTTNDWRFDGIQKTTYYLNNKSSYTQKTISVFDAGIYIHVVEYRINNKTVSKDDFLMYNKVSRALSMKDATNTVLKNKYITE